MPGFGLCSIFLFSLKCVSCLSTDVFYLPFLPLQSKLSISNLKEYWDREGPASSLRGVRCTETASHAEEGDRGCFHPAAAAAQPLQGCSQHLQRWELSPPMYLGAEAEMMFMLIQASFSFFFFLLTAFNFASPVSIQMLVFLLHGLTSRSHSSFCKTNVSTDFGRWFSPRLI